MPANAKTSTKAASSKPAKTSFPKDRIRVLVLEGIHASGRQALSDEGLEVIAHEKALEGAALRKALSDDAGVHLLGIRSKTTLTKDALEAAPRLLAVGAFCIGTNQIDLAEAAKRGVAVFNSPFSNTRSVAELTISEIIALHRRLTVQSERMHKGDWDKSAAGAHEVRGRTLGLVGYGHIGSQVSIIAEALGMRVLFFDIASKLPLGNARPCKTLDELLRASDVVSLHVPATPSTERMIGRAQLRAMPKGSMLINNARGSIVDIPALADALKSGHLAGCALDVFPDEPAGKGDRFTSEVQGLPNVILTPHIGGSTEEAQDHIAQDVVAKLLKFLNNGSTTGSVNLPQVDLPEQDHAGPDATPSANTNAGTDGGATSGPAGSADAPPGARRVHRYLHLHRNVPGVMRKINDVFGARGINVLAQYLQTRGDIGYVVMDVEPHRDQTVSDAVLRGLREMPETIRVRVLW
jgi:D-3-phosphoglycerate dehydrogenase